MDNELQKAAPVNKKIGVEDERELNYWSNKFGISRDELMEVVKRGGTFAEAVEKYVKKVKFAI